MSQDSRENDIFLCVFLFSRAFSWTVSKVFRENEINNMQSYRSQVHEKILSWMRQYRADSYEI